MSDKKTAVKHTDKKQENYRVLSKSKIASYLKNEVYVNCYDVIDSTNNEAKRKVAQLNTPELFVANSQTAGRGRLGRSFYSPTDTGLYMSLCLKAGCNADDIICMTAAAAVCVADALTTLFDIEPKIKWVNDIYLNDKKICGILCEGLNNKDNSALKGIVIGIGINISTTIFPDELTNIAGSVGGICDRNRLCALITDNLIEMQKHIEDRAFIKKYKERSMVLGKEITCFENGKQITATAIDVDRNGGLVIKSGDTVKTLSSGEISVRLK